VLRADVRVLLAARDASLLRRVAVAFLPVARFCTCVWLLRALVLRARELAALRLREALLRVVLERVLELRVVELLRRLDWLLVAMWITPPRLSEVSIRKVINLKDNKKYSREHAFENP
jgi:hypothetical protein